MKMKPIIINGTDIFRYFDKEPSKCANSIRAVVLGKEIHVEHRVKGEWRKIKNFPNPNARKDNE